MSYRCRDMSEPTLGVTQFGHRFCSGETASGEQKLQPENNREVAPAKLAESTALFLRDQLGDLTGLGVASGF